MTPAFDIEGVAALPRLNGELVFEAPWESRSFAMAAALVEAGHFSWEEFREHLIASVDRWEAAPVGAYRYYERWQEALESISAEHLIVATSELDALAAAYAIRPEGHDHAHPHDHGDHVHDHGGDRARRGGPAHGDGHDHGIDGCGAGR